MIVTALLKQPCNKSDNINKVVTSCQQLVPNLLTTWNKPCELVDGLFADLLQVVSFLRVYFREMCPARLINMATLI